MSGEFTYDVCPIQGARLAALTEVMAPQEMAGRIRGLFDEVAARLGQGESDVAMPLATYELEKGRVTVVAGAVVASDAVVPEGLQAVELPAYDTAVCTEHRGPVTGVSGAWDRLHGWAKLRGYNPVGPARELYTSIAVDEQGEWVVQLQQPVSR